MNVNVRQIHGPWNLGYSLDKHTLSSIIAIAKQVAVQMGVPYIDNVLVKTAHTPQMKDIPAREDRVNALCSAFVVNDVLADGKHDVLVVDDLYDTGSSLEAATIMLRKYEKTQNIFVATLTRKNP